MFKNRLFVLLAFLAVSCGAQASQGLKIETQIARVGTIQYLPINMTITFTNNSSEALLFPEGVYFEDNLHFVVQGKQDFSCLRKPLGTRIPPVPFPLSSILPGAKYTFQREIAKIAGLLNPGTYQVRVVWDSLQAPEGWKGYAESEWSTVAIEEATGVDRLFITAVKAACPKTNWPCVLLDTSFPENIVKRYPSSTYTGWAIVNQGYFYLRPSNMEHISIESYMRDSLDDLYSSPIKKYAKHRIGELESYLTVRPDFSLAHWMQFELAFLYAYQGDYEKAGKLADQLVRDSSQTIGAAKAKELFSYLKEKKLVSANDRP